MKTVLKYSLIVLFVITANAQEFQGEAIYKSHRKMDFKMDGVDEGSEMEKQIQAQLAKQFQKEYTLSFTKTESFYKENERLSSPAPQNNMVIMEVTDGTDVLYKNIKENRFTSQTEIFGKQFLIQDQFAPSKWELSNETKSIGTYTCRKATYKENYTIEVLNEFGQFEKQTKERTTTAWYTMQIPVSNGPSMYNGLPGLILEINDGELTLVCTRVTLNPKKGVKIEEPKKGKKVTQKKFDEIMEKKSKEMQERFRSQRGNGEAIEIRIGG